MAYKLSDFSCELTLAKVERDEMYCFGLSGDNCMHCKQKLIMLAGNESGSLRMSRRVLSRNPRSLHVVTKRFLQYL